ncbi:MAG: transcriptional regulator [Hamadaea sp.]|nr:transcriptional regulator [Hamadaea sp.]NUT07969.1 transcriptional regulator [Hamadaea sp.]
MRRMADRHPLKRRQHARALYATGLGIASVARIMGLPRHTVWYWCVGNGRFDLGPDAPTPCPRCQHPPQPPSDPEAYAYLLGLYLGDGHLTLTAKTPVLRIACDDKYPGIMAEAEAAMLATLARKVQRVRSIGSTGIQSYAKHWPCLLPQAGPGKKHDRPIILEPWQEEIVAAHPGRFLRGLFHSDGCRVVNRVHKGGRDYEYPRYFFSNKSPDIMRLCQVALNRLGVEWRMARPDSLSVARRGAVERLDRDVGPKDG